MKLQALRHDYALIDYTAKLRSRHQLIAVETFLWISISSLHRCSAIYQMRPPGERSTPTK